MPAANIIITIANNEPLVQFLLADEYEAYRKEHPDGVIEVQVKEDVIQYSSESDGMWHDSFWQSLHPEEFDEAVRRIREYEEGKK